MAKGFAGFLEGFATGGAEIIKDQDKQQQAAQLFIAEHMAAAQIDAKMKDLQEQGLVAADKQAIMGGPAPDAGPTPQAGATAASIASGQTSPVQAAIDPQAAAPIQAPNAAPSAAPAPSGFNQAIAGNESSYGKNLQNPTSTAAGAYGAVDSTAKDPGFGVKPAADGTMQERTRVGSDYANAMLTKYNGNPILASLAHYWGPGNTDNWLAKTKGDPTKLPADARQYVGDAVLRMSTQNAAAGGQAPAGAPVAPTPGGGMLVQNTPESVTPDERTAALANIRAAGNKAPVTTEQLNALALKNRTEQEQKNTEKGDEHLRTIAALKGAGLDENGQPMPKADMTDLAKQYGVPVADDRIDPTKNMKPTQAGVYENQLQARLAKEKATLPEIDHNLDVIKQFQQLNQNTTTGGAANALKSIRGQFDGDLQTMFSLNKQGMFSNKPAGLSRITNTEFNVFREAFLSPNNTKDANTNIANGLQAYLTRQKEYIEFKDNYVLVNGHDAGAEQAFRKYMEANPIFAKDSGPKNNFALNPDRQTPQEFFWGVGADGQPVEHVDEVDKKIHSAKQTLNQGQSDAANKLGF